MPSLHIDIAEVQTAGGKLRLFVVINRTSKFAFVRLIPKAGRMTGPVVARPDCRGSLPARCRPIMACSSQTGSCGTTAFGHIFGRACREHGIGHRLKAKHPWTNGQVGRMNRTIREATVRRFHHDNHDQLRTPPDDFIAAYDFARRLKRLNGLTPYEYICKIWTSEPDRCILNPINQMTGLNS